MSDKITVLHFTQAFGGVETSIRAIVGAIDDAKFESILLSPSKDIRIPDKSGNYIRTCFVPVVRSIHPIKDIVSLFKTMAILRHIKPDLVHCHSSKAGFIGRLACWLTGFPSVFTPQALSYLSVSNPLIKRIFFILERIASSWTGLFLACSESEYRRAIEEIKYPGEKCALWKNCIPAVNQRDIVPKNPFDAPFICSIGRPSFQKNIAMLIDVVKKLKIDGTPVKCVLLGAGHHSPEKGRIEELILQNDLQADFMMKEWINHEEAMEIIKASELFILTSRYEGLPYSILEAMALGKAVVATDVDGNRDCINDGETGFLVPLDDADAMCKAIRKISDDVRCRKNMEQQALELFGRSYTAAGRIDELETLYAAVVRNAGMRKEDS